MSLASVLAVVGHVAVVGVVRVLGSVGVTGRVGVLAVVSLPVGAVGPLLRCSRAPRSTAPARTFSSAQARTFSSPPARTSARTFSTGCGGGFPAPGLPPASLRPGRFPPHQPGRFPSDAGRGRHRARVVDLGRPLHHNLPASRRVPAPAHRTWRYRDGESEATWIRGGGTESAPGAAPPAPRGGRPAELHEDRAASARVPRAARQVPGAAAAHRSALRRADV